MSSCSDCKKTGHVAANRPKNAKATANYSKELVDPKGKVQANPKRKTKLDVNGKAKGKFSKPSNPVKEEK